MLEIRKGLDLPVVGEPTQQIDEIDVSTVALSGLDYQGLKPTMLVKVGDQVRLGDPLFACKKVPGVVYTSPGTGEVIEINRGDKRALMSVAIKLQGNEERTFSIHDDESLPTLGSEKVRQQLLESGLWTAIRRRPFSGVARPFEKPSSIFVTAIDTSPLAFDPEIVISRYFEDYIRGIRILTNLVDTWVHHVVHENFSLDMPAIEKCETVRFTGKHPAGLVGTHIHFLDPVNEHKVVWHIGYQDVIAVGKLFSTGKIWTERYVSFAGPAAKNPRIIKTRLGADILQLSDNQLRPDFAAVRLISGSILHGRKVCPLDRFLGRFHQQISALEEDNQRKLLGWIRPGLNKHSVSRTFLSAILPMRKIAMTTIRNGSHRPIVPIGLFEKVFPLRMLPTQLAKSLMTQDIESAIRLGVMELDEEDVSAMTYCCSGKNDYGVLLRQLLTTIEKEG